MAEVGIDISTHSSKRPQDLTQTHGVDFDFVVTVCDSAHESCPVFVGSDGKSHARIVHRGSDDLPRLTNQTRRPRRPL